MFPCTSCGACCRRVYLIPDFSEPILPNGTCSHLTEDNRCGIYDSRPLVCNVEAYRQAFHPEVSQSDFYGANAAICNAAMDEDGLPASLRIPL